MSLCSFLTRTAHTPRAPVHVVFVGRVFSVQLGLGLLANTVKPGASSTAFIRSRWSTGSTSPPSCSGQGSSGLPSPRSSLQAGLQLGCLSQQFAGAAESGIDQLAGCLPCPCWAQGHFGCMLVAPEQPAPKSKKMGALQQLAYGFPEQSSEPRSSQGCE